MVSTGYYQLYFLLVIMQFSLAFPFVLMLLRRTRGHHGLVIAAALLAQVAMAIGMHWNLFPREMDKFGQQDVISYPLYLVGGCVVAFHLDQVHAWVCAHARLIVAMTVAAALAAEGIYLLAANGVTTVLGSGSDPFQPSVIPFNVGAVTCGYLAGVTLVQPRRSRQAKAVVRSGSENAYGIYLSHMLFITMLTRVGWGKFTPAIPWPMLCLVTVAIVFRLRHGADQLPSPDAARGTAHRAHPGALAAAGVLRCTSRRAGERSRPSHAARYLGR
jgi:peptidoglycan/LPS O-acetylase OafA/YrhL